MINFRLRTVGTIFDRKAQFNQTTDRLSVTVLILCSDWSESKRVSTLDFDWPAGTLTHVKNQLRGDVITAIVLVH